MLSGPSHAEAATGHGGGEAARGGERTPPRGLGGGRPNAGVEPEGGTTRFRGAGGSRELDGGSSSEGD